MKSATTWVLIADGAHAKILEVAGPGSDLEAASEEMEGSTAPSRDLGQSKPGRTFDIGGPGRHAMEPPTDPHQKAEDQFLRSVVDHLEDASNKGAFDRLVLVAPPKALSALRTGLSKPLAAKVTGELAKDLTNTPEPDLRDHLRDVVAFTHNPPRGRQ